MGYDGRALVSQVYPELRSIYSFGYTEAARSEGDMPYHNVWP